LSTKDNHYFSKLGIPKADCCENRPIIDLKTFLAASDTYDYQLFAADLSRQNSAAIAIKTGTPAPKSPCKPTQPL
jgi:hypothetical protein